MSDKENDLKDDDDLAASMVFCKTHEEKVVVAGFTVNNPFILAESSLATALINDNSIGFTPQKSLSLDYSLQQALEHGLLHSSQ